MTSIQARRTQVEDDEVLLDELDYQRMLMELQKDTKNGSSSDLGEDYSLRGHVDSIRDLLNDYYDRKAKTNNNHKGNHDSTGSRSALALLEQSITSIGEDDMNNNSNNNNSRTRWDHNTSVASSNGSLGRLSQEMNDLPRRKSRDKSSRNTKSTTKTKNRTRNNRASSSSSPSSSVSLSVSLSSVENENDNNSDVKEGNEHQRKQSLVHLRSLSPPMAPTT